MSGKGPLKSEKVHLGEKNKEKGEEFVYLGFKSSKSYKWSDGKNKKIKNVIVSTLNQGYPLLQHEDAAPIQRLLATRGTAPDPTAWAGQRAPRGKERQHSKSGPHRGTLDPYTYKSGAPR